MSILNTSETQRLQDVHGRADSLIPWLLWPKFISSPPKNLETENTKKGKLRRPKFLPVHHVKRCYYRYIYIYIDLARKTKMKTKILWQVVSKGRRRIFAHRVLIF